MACSKPSRLTPPSRGLACGQPLTSNVSRLREAKVKGQWAVSSVALVQRAGRLDLQACEQQASPAARTAAVALNWCLRSSRIRRASQGRASLPYATPLLLSGSGYGRGDDEYQRQIRERVGLLSQPRFSRDRDQRSWLSVRLASSSRSVARGHLAGQYAPSLCRLPVAGQRYQRLAAEVKTQSQRWQTPPVGGLLNTQPANPSVKGTGLRPAPYVER